MRLKEHSISAQAANLLATTPGLPEGDAEARAAATLTSASGRRRPHAQELQHVDRSPAHRRRMDHRFSARHHARWPTISRSQRDEAAAEVAIKPHMRCLEPEEAVTI